jgi:Toprim-like
MIAKGHSMIKVEDVLAITTEVAIAQRYLNITEIPCLICSPLRKENHPSFSIFVHNGKVRYIDFSTKERGGIFDLLMAMYHLNFEDTLVMVYREFKRGVHSGHRVGKRDSIKVYKPSDTDLKCKVRKWEKHDLEYWESYGISLPWLKYADIHPISHKIVVKNGQELVFGAEKYAYAYVEYKEQHTTLKIYQPFSKNFKWSNKHDRSVISLWTKVPKEGQMLCICSSMKDALCLWANTGIPAIAIQGEGYGISKTALQELKRRFKSIYILLDNDKAGLENASKLAEETGFKNVVLPPIEGCKDISDIFHKYRNKQQFNNILIPLFYENS